ncbi:MAG: hypothetical protein HY547_07625 [Elusimicrobia bacterium]|nr:hypothetical protein [Elusimicrobiota bacterium]
MVNIIIVTHGDFGAYLLEAAEEIVGHDESVNATVVAISRRMPIADVRQKINRALASALENSGSGGVLVLCDMLGGTPCNETLLAARRAERLEVLAGVNLYMVISALMNGRRMDLEALTKKVMEDAKRSVVNARNLLLAKSGN